MKLLPCILFFFLTFSCNNGVILDDHADHNQPERGHRESEEKLLSYATQPSNQIVLGNQKGFVTVLKDTTVSIAAFGTIQLDQRRNHKVPVRTAGRVEKLYTKYDYQYINRGEKIMELYTPELSAYAEEYLHLLRISDETTLLAKAREKLLLLGMTSRQIDHLEKTGIVDYTLEIYSSYEGYILFAVDKAGEMTTMQGALMDNNSSSEMSMGPSSMADASLSISYSNGMAGDFIHEGMYVNKDQTLFVVNDFDEVWAVISFDASLCRLIKVGMPILIHCELLDQPVEGVINFIEPVFSDQHQKFMQVRVYLKNYDHNLKLNAFVKAEVDLSLGEQMFIPSSAILDLGKRKVVWVKVGGTGDQVFEAREVVTGYMGQGMVQVLSGLLTGDTVALDGGYLLDSQSLVELQRK